MCGIPADRVQNTSVRGWLTVFEDQVRRALHSLRLHDSGTIISAATRGGLLGASQRWASEARRDRLRPRWVDTTVSQE